MDASFIRARAALHLDLAASLLRTNVLDEARAELSIAERMARKVGSRRQLERALSLRAARRGEQMKDADQARPVADGALIDHGQKAFLETHDTSSASSRSVGGPTSSAPRPTKT